MDMLKTLFKKPKIYLAFSFFRGSFCLAAVKQLHNGELRLLDIQHHDVKQEQTTQLQLIINKFAKQYERSYQAFSLSIAHTQTLFVKLETSLSQKEKLCFLSQKIAKQTGLHTSEIKVQFQMLSNKKQVYAVALNPRERSLLKGLIMPFESKVALIEPQFLTLSWLCWNKYKCSNAFQLTVYWAMFEGIDDVWRLSVFNNQDLVYEKIFGSGKGAMIGSFAKTVQLLPLLNLSQTITVFVFTHDAHELNSYITHHQVNFIRLTSISICLMPETQQFEKV